ncbi:MAG: shikimate dehydrogenase [Gammaproteobacteria bacterium]
MSPEIHARFADQTGEALTYERIEAPLDGFAGTVAEFFASGGRGCNVTVPFKGEAAAWVGSLDALAAFAEAVNTIVADPSGGHRGHNTDGPGLVKDLERWLGSVAGMRVLLLGAGGAARGVVRPLVAASIGELVIANRTASRAHALAARLASVAGATAVGAGFSEIRGPFDLVLNATSAGLADAVPDVAPDVVRGAACYDLVYGPGRTAFCRWSAGAGARAVRDGLGMLVEQAALAFELWRGVKPETGSVLDDLTAGLGARSGDPGVRG